MELITILVILAIANLITEQKIVRDVVIKIFNPEFYLEWSKIKRFFFDMISCFSCLSFHVGWIYLLATSHPFGFDYIIYPLVCMLIADTLLKLKR